MKALFEMIKPYWPFVLCFFLLFIGLYVLFAYSLQTICHKTNKKYAWLSWIPLINLYILGKLAWNESIGIIFVLITFLGSQISVSVNGSIMLKGLLPLPFIVVIIFDIISVILYFICIEKLFHRFSKKYVLYFLLSFFSFGILGPIILFIIRNNSEIKPIEKQDNSVLDQFHLHKKPIDRSKNEVYPTTSEQIDYEIDQIRKQHLEHIVENEISQELTKSLPELIDEKQIEDCSHIHH